MPFIGLVLPLREPHEVIPVQAEEQDPGEDGPTQASASRAAHEEQFRLLAVMDLRDDSNKQICRSHTNGGNAMREPHWNDYSDDDEWASDHDAWKRAETYGISDITGPDDARRRIDARFEDLDAIEWPGRTKQARENERRLVEAIMLDMYDRGNIYAHPSKRYLSKVSGMAKSPAYRVLQRVMTIPGLFRWVRKPGYRKQGKIRLRVGEAGPAAEGRTDAVGVHAANRAHDLGTDVDPWADDLGADVDPWADELDPDAGPEVGPRSGSLSTLEPNPHQIPNVVHKGDIEISTGAELDQASNFLTAPVRLAASGGSENTGPKEPWQLGEENQALLPTPSLVTVKADERARAFEPAPEPESSADDAISAEDIALAELMFGFCDEYSLSYVREHRP
jgi:hypothetical protein